MRVVATAGHVDHGKSSLVHALTGTDPDRFDEEKRRGLTIDLGFAHTVLPSGGGHLRSSTCPDTSASCATWMRSTTTSCRGAYVAYIGAGEHPTVLRVLGAEVLAPGTDGTVRLFLDQALPLLPGTGSCCGSRAGTRRSVVGENPDIAPVLRASKAAPDRTMERLVRERGWVTAAELEALTGEPVEAMVGGWLTTPEMLDSMRTDLVDRVTAAGPAGLDVAAFDDREPGRCWAPSTRSWSTPPPWCLADVADPYAGHPYLDELLAGGFAPLQPDAVDRGELRRGSVGATSSLAMGSSLPRIDRRRGRHRGRRVAGREPGRVHGRTVP